MGADELVVLSEGLRHYSPDLSTDLGNGQVTLNEVRPLSGGLPVGHGRVFREHSESG